MTEGITARFRTMAISRAAVLAGHVLGNTVQAIIAVVVVLGVGLLVGFRPTADRSSGSPPLGMIALIAFAISWLAVAMGMQAKSVETASNLPMLLLLLPFLGSGFVPTDSMPAWLQWFAQYQPFTPFIETLRGLLLGTDLGGNGWLSLLWIVALTLTGWLTARVLYARKRPRYVWAVGRTTISLTSTSAGCSIAKAMARAIAAAGIADRRRASRDLLARRRDWRRGCASRCARSPGEMVVTRTVSSASWRSPSEIVRTALRAGVDGHGRHDPVGRRGGVFTKCPPPCSRNTGSAAAIPNSTPLMFTSTIRSQASTSSSSSGPIGITPALLTSTSSRPKRSRARSTRRAHVLAAGHVDRPRARRRMLRGERLQPVLPARADHHVRPARGQPPRGRLADPAARARDGHDLVS